MSVGTRYTIPTYSYVSFAFLSGEILGFDTVILSIFEFIHGLIECSKFRAVVRTHLEQLLYFLLVFMEITEDQVVHAVRNLREI